MADCCLWRVWPAAAAPGRAAGTVAVALVTGVCAYYLFRNPTLSVAAAALLLASTAEFLLPTTYTLNASGAEARNPLSLRRIAWPEVQRVYRGEGAVKLSPLARSSRLEPFRGVLLRCPENQEAVLALIERLRSGEEGPGVAP